MASDLQRQAVEEFIPRWLELHRLLNLDGRDEAAFRARAMLAVQAETSLWEPLAYLGIVDRKKFVVRADEYVRDAGAWAAEAVEEYRRTRDEALRASYDVTFERVNFLRSIGLKGPGTRAYGSGTIADDAPKVGLGIGVIAVGVIALVVFLRK